MSHFTTHHKVAFQHCDPAGIVFYPRYFELINAVVEQWFEDALGESFAAIIEAGDGVPTRHIKTDFPRPTGLGETLTFTLDVTGRGRTSLALHLAAACGGETRLVADLTLVRIGRDHGHPKPWPPAIAATLDSLTAKDPWHGKD